MSDVLNEQILGMVEKNRDSVIRVYVGDYLQRPYIYVRIFPREKLPEPVPHPGLTLRPDMVRELLPLLNEALDVCAIRERIADDDDDSPDLRRRRR